MLHNVYKTHQKSCTVSMMEMVGRLEPEASRHPLHHSIDGMEDLGSTCHENHSQEEDGVDLAPALAGHNSRVGVVEDVVSSAQ